MSCRITDCPEGCASTTYVRKLTIANLGKFLPEPASYEKKVQRASLGGQFRQKLPERCYGGFLPFYSVYTHHVRDPDDSSHVDLDSCFLKCVDKLKGCQDIYLQKHYCTHPSNMTHPYIMTLACAVMVLSNYLVFA